jgi:uncharacterized membrane-anchored protein
MELIYDSHGNTFSTEELEKIKMVIQEGIENTPVHTCEICGKFLKNKNKPTHKKCGVIHDRLARLKRDVIRNEFILYCIKHADEKIDIDHIVENAE